MEKKRGFDDIAGDIESTVDQALKRAKNGEVRFRMLFISDNVGKVIGKNGENLKYAREILSCKAHVRVPEIPANCSNKDRILMVTCAMDDVPDLIANIAPNFWNGINEKKLNMLIPFDLAGAILGQKGENLKQIRDKSGCKVRMFKEKLPFSDERILEILGTESMLGNMSEVLVEVLKTMQDRPMTHDYIRYVPHVCVDADYADKQCGGYHKAFLEARGGVSTQLNNSYGGHDNSASYTTGGGGVSERYQNYSGYPGYGQNTSGNQGNTGGNYGNSGGNGYTGYSQTYGGQSGGGAGYDGWEGYYNQYGQGQQDYNNNNPAAANQSGGDQWNSSGYNKDSSTYPRPGSPSPGTPSSRAGGRMSPRGGRARSRSPPPRSILEEFMREDITKEFMLDNAITANVIGPKGSRISAIRQQTTAMIKIGDDDSVAEGKRKMVISGTLKEVMWAFNAVKRLIKDAEDEIRGPGVPGEALQGQGGAPVSKMMEQAQTVLPFTPSEDTSEEPVDKDITIPNKNVGQVLGRRAAIISEIRNTSNCKIIIEKDGEVVGDDRKIKITGKPKDVHLAEYLISAVQMMPKDASYKLGLLQH